MNGQRAEEESVVVIIPTRALNGHDRTTVLVVQEGRKKDRKGFIKIYLISHFNDNNGTV